jgi:RNA polymerase sigma-70 factor (ECF subfamily)
MIDKSVILGRLTACQNPIADEILREVIHNVVTDYFSTQGSRQLLTKSLDANNTVPSKEFLEIIDALIKATIPVMLFDPLAERDRPLLYALAMRILKNHHEAEDVVQESLIKAYIAMKGFSLEQLQTLRMRPWLCTIVRNTANNHRTRAKKVESVDPSESSRFLEIEAWKGEQPEIALIAKETAEEIGSLLKGLPPKYAVVIFFRFMEEFSYEEIAAMLDVSSIGTLKSRLHRGIRLMRDKTKDMNLLEF